jgi:hypothetical protein
VILENQHSLFAVIGVAIMIAVGELCPDFPQIARTDWLTAQHTDRLLAGRCAVHQDESHVARRFVPKISGTAAHFRLLWALRGSWLVSNPCLPLGSWFRACEANPLGDADIRSASVR